MKLKALAYNGGAWRSGGIRVTSADPRHQTWKSMLNLQKSSLVFRQFLTAADQGGDDQYLFVSSHCAKPAVVR